MIYKTLSSATFCVQRRFYTVAKPLLYVDAIFIISVFPYFPQIKEGEKLIMEFSQGIGL